MYHQWHTDIPRFQHDLQRHGHFIHGRLQIRGIQLVDYAGCSVHYLHWLAVHVHGWHGHFKHHADQHRRQRLLERFSLPPFRPQPRCGRRHQRHPDRSGVGGQLHHHRQQPRWRILSDHINHGQCTIAQQSLLCDRKYDPRKRNADDHEYGNSQWWNGHKLGNQPLSSFWIVVQHKHRSHQRNALNFADDQSHLHDLGEQLWRFGFCTGEHHHQR